MPGIAGAVAPGNREHLEVRVKSMLAGLLSKTGDETDWRVREGCSLGRLHRGDPKPVAEGNAQILTYYGDFPGEPRPEIDGTARSWAEQLLARYRAGGARALGGLNGLYAVALWDTREKRLTLISDRYGFRKLYYCQSGNAFLFASEIKALVNQAELDPALDEQTLVEFMAVGYPLDDRTFFKNVKLLPPGTVLTFRKGQLTLEPYWDYTFEKEGDSRSDDDCIDEFAERLKTAVQRRARPGMCIQASGGLDSRSILGTVGRNCKGLPVTTVTVGDAEAHDVRFGRQMAEAFRYPHTAIPVGEDYLGRYGAEGVRRTEGSTSCVNFFIFAMDEFLKSSGTQAIVNGFLGDSLTGGHLFPEVAEAGDETAAFDVLYRRFYGGPRPDEDLARLFRNEVYSEYHSAPYDSLRACFLAREGLNTLNRCDYVDLHQRQRRFISGHIDFLSPLVDVIDPYADNDLLDFLLGLPTRMRTGQRIYKDMIRRHLPEVARVPRTGSALPLTVSWTEDKLIRARMRFYHRILPQLTLGKYGNRNLSSAVDFNRCLRGGSRPFATALLGRRDLLEDHFNMDEVNRMLAAYMDGRTGAMGKLTSLMTVALWREQFASRTTVLETV